MGLGLSSERDGRVLKSAAAMGFATLLSRIMGLVREQVFAVLFGAGNLTDAYQVAFRIPNLLRDLFAEGAMSASLVPTFTRTRLEEGDARAWRVAGLVFRVLVGVVSGVSILGMVFAPQLVRLYASAFQQIPGKFELTVRMTREMFPFFPMVALAAAFMGILNACGIFFLPAFASALFNGASILIGVGLASLFSAGGQSWGVDPIEGMAIGVVCGGVVQACCQIPSLYRQGYRWSRRAEHDPIWYQDPRLKTMLGMMIPGTIGLAATQVNLLVNTVLATSQGPGAVSWLNYAFRLMQFPIGIFGVSLASATLPQVSGQWVRKDWVGVNETVTRSLKMVFAVNFPASAGLAFLGFPIIELIFQYGRFTRADAESTAWALAMYSVGLTAYSGVKVLVSAFYALGNTRVPVISSLFSVALTILLNWFMVGPFGYWGLALGTSAAALFNAGFLLVSFSKMMEPHGHALRLRPILSSLGAYLLLALSMGVLCYGSVAPLTSWISDRVFVETFGKFGLVFGRSIRVGLLVIEGVVWFAFWITFFKFEESRTIIDLFKKKFKNKLSRNST
jgi:putative peptidoglycan lipid II flippase